MDVKEYLKQARPTICRETFGSGELSFTVEFALKRKSELEELFKRATKKVRENGQLRDELNQPKLRELLAMHVLRSWDGLSFGKFARMCNLIPPNGDQAPIADEAVPFENVENGQATRPNVIAALEELRGKVIADDGEEQTIAFEAWLLQKLGKIADEQSKLEHDGKNA